MDVQQTLLSLAFRRLHISGLAEDPIELFRRESIGTNLINETPIFNRLAQ